MPIGIDPTRRGSLTLFGGWSEGLVLGNGAAHGLLARSVRSETRSSPSVVDAAEATEGEASAPEAPASDKGANSCAAGRNHAEHHASRLELSITRPAMPKACQPFRNPHINAIVRCLHAFAAGL